MVFRGTKPREVFMAITQTSISKMEREGIKRADKAIALARALQCTVEDIY